MEGKLHCEVRSSLWILFCSIFKRKLFFKIMKRKSKEKGIFVCGCALPKNPKASPGERKMHQKMIWETLKQQLCLGPASANHHQQ